MKKVNIALIISLCSIALAFVSLYLNFVIYKETQAVVFEWEAFSRNDIPLKLNHTKATDEKGEIGHYFYLPIWIQCQITNSGYRTFSVVSIWGAVFIEGDQRTISWLDWDLFEPNANHGVLPKEKVPLPIIVQPGHSRIFITSVRVPIPEKLFKLCKDEFKGKEMTLGDIYRLGKKDQSIGNCKVILEVRLAGGETKTTQLSLDL